MRFVFNQNERDVRFWEKWIKRHPESWEEIALASAFLREEYADGLSVSDSDIEEEWNKLLMEVEHMPDQTPDRPALKATSRWLYKSIAASIAVLISAAILWTIAGKTENTDLGLSEVEALQVVKSNPRGQKLNFKLPDGTRVKLNAQGEIRYHKPFDQAERVVYLKGEAFFDVVRDTKRPFVVVTDPMQVRVLGTSFGVKAHPDERVSHVAVATGKVEVQTADSDPLMLTPYEVALVDVHSQKIEKTTMSPRYLAWKDEVIYFDKADLGEIAITLERWFNVDVEVINLKQQTLSVSGEFKNQSLQNVLKGMSFSSGFDYEITGKKVKIVIN